MLGEALTILSQALRKPPATRQMPDIEDLENNPETGEPISAANSSTPLSKHVVLDEECRIKGQGHDMVSTS
eukprot:symbB.v1.2.013307.t1/scaffold936.1/size150329/4